MNPATQDPPRAVTFTLRAAGRSALAKALRRVAPATLLFIGTLACVDTADSRATPSGVARSDDSVDVELARGKQLPGIACTGAFRVLDARGRQVATGADLSPDDGVEVSRTLVRVGTLQCGPPPVDLVPERGASLSVAGTSYRGALRLGVAGTAGEPVLFNHVSIEDYLLGVVPGEMPERFGLEALKAQAVAARSYALAENAGRGRLYADTRSQVYGGRDAESALASRAVRETRNQVLAHGRTILQAWYHSTCGGRTTPAASVFPSAPAGVTDKAVTCPDCRNSPNFAWLRRFSPERVCTAVELPPAPLEEVSLSAESLPGRPLTIRVRAGGREASVPLLKFRERLSAGRPKDEQLLSTLLSLPPRIEAGVLVIEGRGWGHGVGMCQYGAAGFAARGATYSAILARYYPGAQLTSTRDASVRP